MPYNTIFIVLIKLELPTVDKELFYIVNPKLVPKVEKTDEVKRSFLEC